MARNTVRAASAADAPPRFERGPVGPGANLDQACPGTIGEQTDTRRRGVANDVKRLTGRAPLGLAAFLACSHTLMQTHEPGPTPPQQSPELAMHVCGVSRTLT